jgi:hypothetical protein
MMTWRLMKGLLTGLTLVMVFGGIAFMGTASEASAQTSGDCTSSNDGWYTYWECQTLTNQNYYVLDTVTSASCQPGWSHRKAEQTTTVTTTFVSNTYTWETWRTDPDGIESNYQTWTSGESWFVSATTDVSQCRPITGKPPQN